MMNFNRMKTTVIMIIAAALLSLTGCGLPGAAGTALPAGRAVTVTTNVTGTDTDGFFYSFWKGANEGSFTGSASMTRDTGTTGNYTATWNNVSNFTCGKGWANGSPDRVVAFSGTFTPNNGGENNGYLALYGWAATSTPAPQDYCVVEYYIVENYGQWTPPGSTALGSFNSDDGAYNIHRTTRNGQPWAVNDGNGTFYQYWSVRTSKRSSGTITFANHLQAWSNAGLNDIQDVTQYYQIMETEGYHSGGSSNITVSGSGSGGGEGFSSLAGKYVASGSAYMMIGETRYPVTPDGNKVLDGLFTGMLFHSVSGNSVDVELLLVPLDAATDTQIRAQKDPDPSVYAGMSPSAAAGAKATFWCYNASDLAVSAYRGSETITDGGITINLGSFNFNGIQVNNLVMTYDHVSDDPGPGIPYAQIKYDYTYTVSGKSMEAEGIIFVSENPSSIPQSLPMILQKHAVPLAMEPGDSYSLISAWSGKHVTVTSTGNNAAIKAQPVNEGWTSQDWTAEFVSVKDRIVRLKNIWTGKYLHAQANTENAKAVCYDLHADWLSQQWQVEQTGLLKARLKNMWTNRYLTVVDTGDYADIILKQLNTGWTSQEWKVDWLVWKE